MIEKEENEKLIGAYWRAVNAVAKGGNSTIIEQRVPL